MTDMLDAIMAAKKGGATDAALAPVLELQRQARWRLDFVAAEKSMGFHAPAETARILAESIDDSPQAKLAARK
jgi:nitrite reductase (cytochrome c-552)